LTSITSAALERFSICDGTGAPGSAEAAEPARVAKSETVSTKAGLRMPAPSIRCQEQREKAVMVPLVNSTRGGSGKSVAPEIELYEQSQSDWVIQSGTQKIPLYSSEKQKYKRRHLVPARGAYRHRHDTLGAGCDGRSVSKANGSAAYGQVVWSWRRDAGEKLLRSKSLRGDGDNKPAPPGRARSKP
jgi:hypothetical protein